MKLVGLNWLPLVLITIPGLCSGADTAPDWVREQSTRTLPTYPAEAHTAMLLDEQLMTVQSDGSTVTQLRQAIRILSKEGQTATSAAVPYLQKNTKIKDFRAWLVQADGSVKAYGKNDSVDRAVKQDFELYDDQRLRLIQAKGAPVGSTFAWSAELEDHPLTPQTQWAFQHRDPVLVSRCVLTLPAGWEAKGWIFNHDPLSPTVNGTTYSWELRDLSLIKEEPHSPKNDSLAPWLGISYYPANAEQKSIRNWQDLSVWQTKLAASQANADDALSTKVTELTSGSITLLDRVRSIGRYVQGLKYVAIETNLARGGGYQPHAAVEVFHKQYGDCKDKANLMRTMLNRAGVESYVIALFSGDRNHVRPEWPSADQFNHAILAIRVPADVDAPAVITDAKLGRLLIFDPTDPFTPLGYLPKGDQGGYALLIAGESGGVIQLPCAPPEANRTEVTVEGTLSPDGALEAKLALQDRANRAAEWRALKAFGTKDEFEKVVDAWLARNVKQVDRTQLDSKDSFDKGEFRLDVAFKAPRYAQVMQGRILVFKPSIVEPSYGFQTQAEKRVNPLVLESQCYHKQVRVTLPENFKIDEMPESASFRCSFGKYTSDYKVEGRELIFTEDFDVTATTLPVAQYSEAKEFFGRIAGAERAPLVMIRN